MTQRDLEWADLVLVMEPEHKVRPFEMFKGLPPTECLDITDDYQYMDGDLLTLIRDATESHLSAKFGIGSNGNGPG